MFKILLSHVRNNIKLNSKLNKFVSISAVKCNSSSDKFNSSVKDVPLAVLSKYEPFRDERSPIILDVEEEKRKIKEGKPLNHLEDEEYDQFYGIDPNRGVEGVIDIEEAVAILSRENAQDIFVVEVPPEYRYVRYIIVVHGKSVRHMLGMAEFLRKVFKYKRAGNETIPRIEGKGSKDWIALDLGNIALHIFSKSARAEYDLESLWAVGSEFDKLCNAPEDPVVTLLKQHSVNLSDLTPAAS